jgi:hypothetical protein
MTRFRFELMRGLPVNLEGLRHPIRAFREGQEQKENLGGSPFRAARLERDQTGLGRNDGPFFAAGAVQHKVL